MVYGVGALPRLRGRPILHWIAPWPFFLNFPKCSKFAALRFPQRWAFAIFIGTVNEKTRAEARVFDD
jgi:hypothetical protein